MDRQSTLARVHELPAASPSSARRFGGEILNQIFSAGFARVELGRPQISQLNQLQEQADIFFSAGSDHNSSYSVSRFTNGYRPPKGAHGGDSEHPDANDAFLYWDRRFWPGIPRHEEIEPFLESLEMYRLVVRGIMRTLMDELVVHYEDNSHPFYPPRRFEDASFLQLNSYRQPSTSEFLQTQHEDGVLATVLWANGPGLEHIPKHGSHVPITPDSNEVIVFPGKILTAMTAGEIQPFYHQVRNHRQASMGRLSIMYFSVPNVRHQIPPYKLPPLPPSNVATGGFDNICDIAIQTSEMFGKYENFLIDH